MAVRKLNSEIVWLWDSPGQGGLGVSAPMLPFQLEKQSSMENESVLHWGRGEAYL